MELNWPTAALVLGLAALAVFRAPLARLIERTVKVKDWLEAPKQPALPAPSADALPTRNPADEQKAVEELTQGFNSQLLLIQEEAIRSDLAKHGFIADGACEKVLLRHLAGTQIALQFERACSFIYQSQVLALRWLNSQSSGVTSAQVKVFYDQAAAKWPALYVGFEYRNWLVFLAAHGLITESDESIASADDSEPFGLTITVRGREFLAYLVSAGKSDPVVG